MADIEPPTFSLGLDLDIESVPRIPTHHFQTSTLNPAPNSSSNTPSDDQNGGPQVMDSEEEEEELGPDVMDSDPEPGPGPTRVLRRLRRGPATQKSKVRKVELEGFCCDHGDDDIEEFSSQEDFGVRGKFQKQWLLFLVIFNSFEMVFLRFFFGIILRWVLMIKLES
jgi:hypothetical protein